MADYQDQPSQSIDQQMILCLEYQHLLILTTSLTIDETELGDVMSHANAKTF